MGGRVTAADLQQALAYEARQRVEDSLRGFSQLTSMPGTASTGQWAPTGEIRVTDPVTGGQKGQKPERFDLIPAGAMEEVARVYGAGARKYDAHNWAKGYSWNLSIGALERHLAKFKQGLSIDDQGPESTMCHHLACVVFHALALMTFERHGLGTDDRLKLGAGK